jgi:hypothetical protein
MKNVIALLFFSVILALPEILPAALWQELHTAPFIVRYQGPEQKRAAFLLKMAEETRDAALQTIGAVPTSPCLICLAPSFQGRGWSLSWTYALSRGGGS